MASTYQEALELVRHAGTGKLMEQKKIGNNTWARLLEDESVAVRLHGTDVVTFMPDGRVKLDSGGWRTVTTKARMNEHARAVRVYSERGRWFVSPTGWLDTVAVPFYDGIEIDSTRGAVLVDPERVDGEAARLEAARLLRARVRRFVMLLEDRERSAAFVEQITGGGSWAGDCFYCVMRTEDGTPLGDSSGVHDHLELHLEEEYLVPSMFLNAYREQYGELGDRRLWMLAFDAGRGSAIHHRRSAVKAVGNYLVKRLVEGGN
jgi:hypothetical protein